MTLRWEFSWIYLFVKVYLDQEEAKWSTLQASSQAAICLTTQKQEYLAAKRIWPENTCPKNDVIPKKIFMV